MTNDETGIDPEALRAFGDQVSFGETASDYASHRAGFPTEFFDLLASRGFATPGQQALDIGTGTGTIARGLAEMGLHVTGIDPAPELIAEARILDQAAGVQVSYQAGTAEKTGLDANQFDLITAGQCWHWFDRSCAAQEIRRLLRPGGRLVIAHFDWLPLPGTVIEATEALILRHNPDWAGAGGTGIYPAWLGDMAGAGFEHLQTVSFDVPQDYSHAAWRGRIRASAGVAASLNTQATKRFDAALAALLKASFPHDPLNIPHRVWLATGLVSKE